MKPSPEAIRKALRRAMREIDLQDQTGWCSVNRPYKNYKQYNRKNKHKFQTK